MTVWLPSGLRIKGHALRPSRDSQQQNSIQNKRSSLYPRVSLLRFLLFLPLLTLLTVCTYENAFANNLAIDNVELVKNDPVQAGVNWDGTIQIEFDISWENAWRDSVNHDAVWVFAKYCYDTDANCGATGNTAWSHVTLFDSGIDPDGTDGGSRLSGDFSSLEIVVPDDKKGAFVQPGHAGSESTNNIDFENVQLSWDYIADGLTSAQVVDDDASGSDMHIRLFGVEMVYIPEGGFYVGDADGYATIEYRDNTTKIPGFVDSEEAIIFSTNSTNNWYYATGGNSNEDATGTSFTLNESFPKGFMAIYAMKYEISQGQYADFLSSVNDAAQDNLMGSTAADDYIMANTGVLTDNSALRNESAACAAVRCEVGADLDAGNNGTTGDSTFNETNDGAGKALNYMQWTDIAAYSDWAALRPMTEFEYEKIVRGPIFPIPGEFAWGTTGIVTTVTEATRGQSTEDVTEAGTSQNGVANYGRLLTLNTRGPLRVGFAAADGSEDTRAEAGASYYGVLELTGNVWEMAVTIGNSDGRSFSGTHGDGSLLTGRATNPDWPGFSSGTGVDSAAGSGIRGGSWITSNDVTPRLAVSNRSFAAQAQTARINDVGGRAVRTAPFDHWDGQ